MERDIHNRVRNLRGKINTKGGGCSTSEHSQKPASLAKSQHPPFRYSPEAFRFASIRVGFRKPWVYLSLRSTYLSLLPLSFFSLLSLWSIPFLLLLSSLLFLPPLSSSLFGLPLRSLVYLLSGLACILEFKAKRDLRPTNSQSNERALCSMASGLLVSLSLSLSDTSSGTGLLSVSVYDSALSRD